MAFENLKKDFQGLNHFSSEGGVRGVKDQGFFFLFKNGKLENLSFSEEEGAMVEVFHKKQIFYEALPGYSSEQLQKSWNRALEKGKKMEGHEVAFSSFPRTSHRGQYSSLERVSSEVLSQGDILEICDFLANSHQHLKTSSKIVDTHCYFVIHRVNMVLLNTLGQEILQDFYFLCTHFEATASGGGLSQSRSHNGGHSYCYQKDWREVYEDVTPEVLRRVGLQAEELLTAEPCPSMKTELVLAPNQMLLQIHESIGHPLELDRILGDEMNYAGGSFVRLEDFGKLQYGSEILNVSFDPTYPQSFARYDYDDSGKKSEKVFLIEKGVLKRPLGGIESMLRAGFQEGTANFRSAGWQRAPIDRIANINVEPGESSMEEILSSIEEGIFMESNCSWSIDDFRNKFQFGCEYAKKIEKGKLTKTYRNPCYRGVSSQFWKSLKSVGDVSTMECYGSPYCGKGEPNQVIRVGHASPTCHFGGVEVFSS